MTRLTPTSGGYDGEDDELYTGVLVSAKIEKSKNAQYPDDQLHVVWEARAGAKADDYLSLKLGNNASTGAPSKLRQMLNALAEHDKADELWFDPDTLEWGYDLDGEDETPAYAKLTPGMTAQFKGENRPSKNGSGTFYKITGYRAPKAKRK
jgi:hypothetical protein